MPSARDESIDLPLDAELVSWNWGVEASFVAGDEASLVLKVDGTEIPMEVSPGVSTVMAPVNSAITQVTLTSADSSATVCLVGLAFGPSTVVRVIMSSACSGSTERTGGPEHRLSACEE